MVMCHMTALQKLQTALNSRPFMRILNLSNPFTDDSFIGISACLVQLPTRYLSRKLTPAEQKWAVQNQEVIAVCWAIGKLACYLLGRYFYICTDHIGLTVLPSGNMPRSKRIYWSLLLKTFSYSVIPVITF